MAYVEIEKESFLHKNGEERVFFADKDARRRITDLEQGGGGEGGGADGYSPVVTITAITGGHRITITDKEHPSGQTFDVMDGAPGAPGTSPTVSVEAITGGHRVTIGANSFDVMDGDDYVLTNQDKADIAALVPSELPAVTASDNGKFFCVVNGAWAAATVPSAESNSFGGGS